MEILIIEDEKPAAKRLIKLIQQFSQEYHILEVIDSVEGAVKWLKEHEMPSLIFMDIQLADGLSLDIFSQTEVLAPIIFTTAYDQYMQQAFKVNSIDYLLKPIDLKELKAALTQYEKFHRGSKQAIPPTEITQLLESLQQKNYKERFLVKIGQQLIYIKVTDIAYFYSKEGLVFAAQTNAKRHNIDYTLDQLEEVLSPKDYFRINRQLIVQLPAIHKIHTYFNSRLKIELHPSTELETIVSRDRVGAFKRWLDA